MNRLKWFSGGTERRDEAISILELLIQDLKDENHLDSLYSLLISYYNELKNGAGSVPYILSRLNIEMSHVLIE
ncbi:bacteriocin immunity protein [Streptococcus ovuberis]|uniref:bacteriocin immunity protein n=1 Tax=Streptococcus ovuberis TaxID=1936207 RepID=UPI001FE93665|nr:bacteriocin immunity protein [Streptococcus ovuberis]